MIEEISNEFESNLDECLLEFLKVIESRKGIGISEDLNPENYNLSCVCLAGNWMEVMIKIYIIFE